MEKTFAKYVQDMDEAISPQNTAKKSFWQKMTSAPGYWQHAAAGGDRDDQFKERAKNIYGELSSRLGMGQIPPNVAKYLDNPGGQHPNLSPDEQSLLSIVMSVIGDKQYGGKKAVVTWEDAARLFQKVKGSNVLQDQSPEGLMNYLQGLLNNVGQMNLDKVLLKRIRQHQKHSSRDVDERRNTGRKNPAELAAALKPGLSDAAVQLLASQVKDAADDMATKGDYTSATYLQQFMKGLS